MKKAVKKRFIVPVVYYFYVKAENEEEAKARVVECLEPSRQAIAERCPDLAIYTEIKPAVRRHEMIGLPDL